MTHINRRLFLQSLAAAAAARPAATRADTGFGPLRPDPARVLDLPAGFRYDIISQSGDALDDGLRLPARPDGMAAFAGPEGRVILVRNHENAAPQRDFGPFVDGEMSGRYRIYDAGGGQTPGTGGTSTVVWNPAERRVERQFMSLLGTELNCAGGATPWGSWLSCEECFFSPGDSFGLFGRARRERRHGYVFEVPAGATEAVEPVPLTAMGRFEHEAAAVDPASGAVYLTEDRERGLFYRFLPKTPGRLVDGGRLQALMVRGKPGFDTRNWSRVRDFEPGWSVAAEWLDLEGVDPDTNDLRLRGHDAGAAIFARGEGLCYAAGELVFTCTSGGRERLGQVWAYRPTSGDAGRLRLIAEATPDSILRDADNVTASPWGDLIVCEDSPSHSGLVGVRPDGSQYALADNAYTPSELAGACFSPDGRTLFVNIQVDGLTLAISGPWPRAAA